MGGEAANAMVLEVKRQFEDKAQIITEGENAGQSKLLLGLETPDYAQCIAISTDASLREMILPGLMVILSPIFTGIFFGVEGVCGLLVGGLTSGVQLAISQSNAGGAWDNAKKYVERGEVLLTSGFVVKPVLNEHGEHMKDEKGNNLMEERLMEKVERALDNNDVQMTTKVKTPEGKDEDKPLYRHGKGSEVHKGAVVGDTVGDPLKDTSGPALNILMKLMAIISLVFADFFCGINHGQGLFETSRKVMEMSA